MLEIFLLAAEVSSEVFIWFVKKCLVSEVIPLNPQGNLWAGIALPSCYLVDDSGKPPHTEAGWTFKKTVRKPAFTLCLIRLQTFRVLLADNCLCFFVLSLVGFLNLFWKFGIGKGKRRLCLEIITRVPFIATLSMAITWQGFFMVLFMNWWGLMMGKWSCLSSVWLKFLS